MSFISFNENYYRQRLGALENKQLSDCDIYETQQLLKVLEDLTDEGYTELSDYVEKRFSCLTRLRALLKSAGYYPFPIEHNGLCNTSYSTEEYEISELLDVMISKAKVAESVSYYSFINNIYEYSRWIGYEEGTAYIFLLRDALLPYVYFKRKYGKSVYPWLIGRRFLENITGIKNVDDRIRLPIYEALESGCTTFESFFAFCKDGMLVVLDKHLGLKQVLLDLLGSIKEKRIIVVESGYAGTIPMMLKAIDGRVNFKLYTTAPFLYETYKNHIFCRRYEDIRKFETVYSHNLLFRYSSYRNRRFYVNLSDEDIMFTNSLAEIKRFTD